MKIIIISIIIFVLPFLISGDVNINKCWINPNGWKLPDLKMFKKASFEIKNFAYVKESILVERYNLKDEKKYFIYDKKCETDFQVYLNVEIEREINFVEVYKTIKNKVLLYVIHSFEQDRVAQNIGTGVNIVYSGGTAYINILVDLNEDSLYESLFDGLSNTLNPDEIIIEILKFRNKWVRKMKKVTGKERRTEKTEKVQGKR